MAAGWVRPAVLAGFAANRDLDGRLSPQDERVKWGEPSARHRHGQPPLPVTTPERRRSTPPRGAGSPAQETSTVMPAPMRRLALVPSR
jgi:hypothetical protein